MTPSDRKTHPRRAASRKLRERKAEGGPGGPRARLEWASDQALSFVDDLLDEVCLAMGVGPAVFASDRVSLATFVPGSLGLVHFAGTRARTAEAVACRLSEHFGFAVRPANLDQPLPEFLRDLRVGRTTRPAAAGPAPFDIVREVLGVAAVETADGRALPPHAVDFVLMYEANARHQRNYLRMSRDVAAGGETWLASYYPGWFSGKPAEARAHAAEGVRTVGKTLADMERCLREIELEFRDCAPGELPSAWPLAVVFVDGRRVVVAGPGDLVRLLEAELGEPFVVVNEWPEGE